MFRFFRSEFCHDLLVITVEIMRSCWHNMACQHFSSTHAAVMDTSSQKLMLVGPAGGHLWSGALEAELRAGTCIACAEVDNVGIGMGSGHVDLKTCGCSSHHEVPPRTYGCGKDSLCWIDCAG